MMLFPEISISALPLKRLAAANSEKNQSTGALRSNYGRKLFTKKIAKCLSGAHFEESIRP